MTSATTRVLLVDGERRRRQALAPWLDGTPGLSVVGSFGRVESALGALPCLVADVALVSLGARGRTGIEGVRRLRGASPATQVLALAVRDGEADVLEAICAGASGYLLQGTPPPRLVEAIGELCAGGAPMSPCAARAVVGMLHRVAARTPVEGLSRREGDVLTLLAAGHSYKTAAGALAVSLDTVRFHVRHIYDKLRVHSKSAAVMQAWKQGMLR